jgi:hypothetical protein
MSVLKARGNKDEDRGFTCMHKLKEKPETGELAGVSGRAAIAIAAV